MGSSDKEEFGMCIGLIENHNFNIVCDYKYNGIGIFTVRNLRYSSKTFHEHYRILSKEEAREYQINSLLNK